MSKLVAGLVAGAAVGAGAGLLLAPKAGKVTRRFVAMRLRRNARALRQKIKKGEGVLTPQEQVDQILGLGVDSSPER